MRFSPCQFIRQHQRLPQRRAIHRIGLRPLQFPFAQPVVDDAVILSQSGRCRGVNIFIGAQRQRVRLALQRIGGVITRHQHLLRLYRRVVILLESVVNRHNADGEHRNDQHKRQIDRQKAYVFFVFLLAHNNTLL